MNTALGTGLALDDADLERRFGGLRRLYGPTAYLAIRQARIAVVGVGGVGSWVAEALARCGVAGLILIDLDHIAESNINRQVQALSTSLGQAKVQALRERIAQIHPACEVQTIEDFVAEDNWPTLLPPGVDLVIDACDDRSAKWTMARWALQNKQQLIIVGAAGGKRAPHLVQVADLLHTTHDPLLAALRQRLRKENCLPQASVSNKASTASSGLSCVFSKETSLGPQDQDLSCATGTLTPTVHVDTSLNCHGFGSVVTVTATFGMVAANLALEFLTSDAR